MFRCRAIPVAVLLLVWCATPALACLQPGQQLTPAEQRCCQQMGGACHRSSEKHSCCEQVQPQDQTGVMTAREGCVAPEAMVESNPAPAAPAAHLPAGSAQAFFSPPHSPPAASISILRI